MYYMKHETAKKTVIPKSKAEKLTTISSASKSKSSAKSGAKKTAGSTTLNVVEKQSVSTIKSAKKEFSLNVPPQNIKSKAEKTVSNISVKSIKTPKVNTIVSFKKAKTAVIKAEPKITKAEAKQKIEKFASKVSIKTIEPKTLKSKANSETKVVRPESKTLKTTVLPKTTKPITEIEKAAAKNVSATTKIVSGAKKILPLSAAKINLKTSVEPVQPQTQKVEPTKVKKTKAVEPKVETTNLPIPKPPKKKKIKPISSAVFRGKKDRYSFEVFALTEEFEPVPAVFVISRRKTDRLKKAHHSLVCIGQTNSIFDELKKLRKGKCVKKHQANVISILPEGDEKIRLRIENDLKAAHSVACSFE